VTLKGRTWDRIRRPSTQPNKRRSLSNAYSPRGKLLREAAPLTDIQSREAMFSSLKKLIVCTTLAVGVLFVIELGCRFLEPGPIRFVDEFPYTPDQTLGQLHQPGFEGAWRGSHFGINSLGLRGPEPRDPSTPGVYRVLCLGSSLTYGAGVADEDSWPRLLEEHLAVRMPEREVEVLNLGVRGWNSEHYLEAWRRFGVDLVPDLVILEYSLHDLLGVRELLMEVPFPEPTPSDGLFSKLSRAAVVRHFRAEWRHRGHEARMEELNSKVNVALEDWRPEGGSSLREGIAELVEEIRATNAHPALLCFPSEFQVRIAEADRSPQGSLGMICAGLDVPYYAVGPTFRQYLAERSSLRPAVFLRGDLFHLNRKGHELISLELFISLEHSGVLP